MTILSLLGSQHGTAGVHGTHGTAVLHGTHGTTAGTGLGATGIDLIVAGTLITNRDGIGGLWRGTKDGAPEQLPFDSTNNLEHWGPAERAFLYDFELVSRLGFRKAPINEKDETIIVEHAEDSSYVPLFTITRPKKEIFNEQIVFVKDYAALRSDRVAEITAQLGLPITFFSSIVQLDPNRTRWTLELLHAALRFASIVVMRCKHSMACRRPQEYSPQIQPIISTPLHSAYPSGHAVQAFITAKVLCHLLRKSGHPAYADGNLVAQLKGQAARIAINRTVAGVHFPVDSAAGAVLGSALADYLISRCKGLKNYQPWMFDGSEYSGRQDFDWTEYFNPETGQLESTCSTVASKGDAQPLSGHSELLTTLWANAEKEW